MTCHLPRRATQTLGASLLLALTGAAQAQSLPIGKALYNNYCQACHGTPPQLRDSAGLGANNATLIRATITSNKGGMGALSSLTTQDLTDVAAYLGNYSGVAASASTSAERLLNWAEWKYQTTLLPRASSQTIGVYTARYYATPGAYVGTDGTAVYIYTSAGGLSNIGTLSAYLSQASADGF